MDREPFIVGTASYGFDHLKPFTVPVAPLPGTGSDAHLLVTFSHHVFSLKWDPAVHQAANAIIEDGEQRCFCPCRHGWSQHLEAHIRYHVAGKAYESRDRNGILNHLFYEDQGGRQVPYAIYFRLRKAQDIKGAQGVLHILSAYENPDLPARNRLQSVRFARLVGQKVGFPPL